MSRDAEADYEITESEIDAHGEIIKMIGCVDRRQYVGCFHCDAPICKLTNMEQSQPLVVEHMKVCPKHPMRELEAESIRLKRRVEELEAENIRLRDAAKIAAVELDFIVNTKGMRGGMYEAAYYKLKAALSPQEKP